MLHCLTRGESMQVNIAEMMRLGQTSPTVDQQLLKEQLEIMSRDRLSAWMELRKDFLKDWGKLWDDRREKFLKAIE